MGNICCSNKSLESETFENQKREILSTDYHQSQLRTDTNEMESSTEAELSPSKVIVVAGFLGAGKTTLIDSILKAPKLSKRVAVI